MNHIEIINYLAEKYKFGSYLEIGCENNENCFNHIKINYKVGIDPNSGGTLRMTSDEFFGVNLMNFDLIFVDGLHHASQVYKDIINSLSCCSGIIVCHDMNPTSEIMQKIPRMTGEWTGNGWEAWVKIRREREDLEMIVLDTDYGVGIIKKGNQKKLEIDCEVNYDNLSKFRENWLNLKTIDKLYSI